jgi:hypothetical protein
VREKPHGENFPPVVVDRSDKTKIVCDIENGDGPIAFYSHLIGMIEDFPGLAQVLPFRSSCNSLPIIE